MSWSVVRCSGWVRKAYVYEVYAVRADTPMEAVEKMTEEWKELPYTDVECELVTTNLLYYLDRLDKDVIKLESHID